MVSILMRALFYLFAGKTVIPTGGKRPLRASARILCPVCCTGTEGP